MPIWLIMQIKKKYSNLKKIMFEITRMVVCYFRTTGNLMTIHDMSWRILLCGYIVMSITFIHQKMNNDDRYRINAQIHDFLTNTKICDISLFYKYVWKHICRLDVLNGLTEISELWEFPYKYFKQLVIDYVQMLSNRNWERNSNNIICFFVIATITNSFNVRSSSFFLSNVNKSIVSSWVKI